MALTEKEKAFALGIIDGKTQSQSYIDAYCPKTENMNTIGVMACRVANKPHVKQFISEYKEKIERQKMARTQVSIEDRKNIIFDRIQACIARGDDAAVARYVDILNRMDGVYVNLSKDLTENDNKLATLSTAELKKILQETDQPKQTSNKQPSVLQ